MTHPAIEQAVKAITRENFIEATGREPEQDDLERCNCDKAGEVGHMFCGWDYTLNKPVFEALRAMQQEPSKTDAGEVERLRAALQDINSWTSDAGSSEAKTNAELIAAKCREISEAALEIKETP